MNEEKLLEVKNLSVEYRTDTGTVYAVNDVSFELYEGEIVGEFDPKTTDVQTLGLYMAGAKRMEKEDRK